jgi:hypothetical protein
MSTNENITKETHHDLDSLVLFIKHMAAKVTELTMPNPADIKYDYKKVKRSQEISKSISYESLNLLLNIGKEYTSAAFTEDEKLKNIIINKLQLNQTERWFVNLDSIVDELAIINSSQKFKIDSYKTLIIIKSYIRMKTITLLLSKYGGDGVGDSIGIAPVKNYLRNKVNRKKNGIAEKIDIVEMAFEGYLEYGSNKAKNYNSDKSGFQFLNSYFSGTVESLICPTIFNDYITSNTDYKIGEKQLLVFRLFSLFMNNKIFHEEEIAMSVYNSFRNYDAYKKKVVKDILDLE